MFYLKIFYSLLFKNFVQGLSLVLLCLLLVFSLSHKTHLENLLHQGKNFSSENPYFYALVSTKENISDIRGKMGVLPGVSEINEISEQQINEEVKNILGTAEVTPQMLSFDYRGLKVVFESGLKKESQLLVREYLNRLSLESSIIIGATREPVAQPKVLDNWEKLLFQFWFLWSGVFVLFVIVLLSLRKKFFDYTYLIEKYQRKRKVALKSFLLGLSSFVLVGLALIPLLPLDLFFLPFSLLVPLVSFLLFAGKYSWKA